MASSYSAFGGPPVPPTVWRASGAPASLGGTCLQARRVAGPTTGDRYQLLQRVYSLGLERTAASFLASPMSRIISTTTPLLNRQMR